MSLPVVEAVVCFIRGDDGRVLMSQRRPSCPFAGLWEFPGGKVEAGETQATAVYRELQEELDIAVTQTDYLDSFEYDYESYAVLLHLWQVQRFQGEPHGVEGQVVKWFSHDEWQELQMLPAGYQIAEYLKNQILAA